ncbi:hypothetical protein K439DRAFT_1621560 [Ramaria rubella]|nr:hypothetical protein K439DRAFT_1621560 [Ramaria rubella]
MYLDTTLNIRIQQLASYPSIINSQMQMYIRETRVKNQDVGVPAVAPVEQNIPETVEDGDQEVAHSPDAGSPIPDMQPTVDHTEAQPTHYSHPHILVNEDLMRLGFIINMHYRVIMCSVCLCPIEPAYVCTHPTSHNLSSLPPSEKEGFFSRYDLQQTFVAPPKPRPPLYPVPTKRVWQTYVEVQGHAFVAPKDLVPIRSRTPLAAGDWALAYD